MKIQVLLFARAREIVGQSQLEFMIPDETDVAGFYERLSSRFPDLSGLEIRVAVNSEYAENGQKLNDGDEVAVIPPISGG